MKIITTILLSLFCTSLFVSQAFAERQPVDEIEAIVNNDVILTSDLNRLRKEIAHRYQKNNQKLPEADDLNKQLLDKLISDRLQLQVATRMGLRINDAQLTQALQQIVADDGLTLDEYQHQLENKGESYQAFVDNVRDELTINEIRQIQVRQRINISDLEVEQMIKRINEQGEKTTQFHFAHILLKIDNKSTIAEQQAVEQLAKQLTEKIQQGADIKALASQYSQGPKALQQGDWGWLSIDEMPTLFADNFDDINTKKDDLIGPFRSKIGLHIIKVLDKKGSQNVFTIEVNARHILLKPNVVLSDEKAKALLNEYRQQIIDGKQTFSALAEAHSQDPGSAVKGGALGWADPSQYVPEFKERALSLPIGEVSEPFRTVHGWHLLQVTERRKSDTTEQATKQKAYSIIFKQRFPAEVYTWLNEIRQEAYIKINNPDYILEAQ